MMPSAPLRSVTPQTDTRVASSNRVGSQSRQLRLAFISPVFLLPADAGGKIRTGNILRSMRGGAFNVTLVSPATVEQLERWASELAQMCDEFVNWQPRPALLVAVLVSLVVLPSESVVVVVVVDVVAPLESVVVLVVVVVVEPSLLMSVCLV